MRTVLACLILVLFATAAAAAGLPVATKTVAFRSKYFDISVKYPQTGNAAVDATLAAYARKSVDDFKAYTPQEDGADRPYALDTTFTVERNDGQMFGVVFQEYLDTGGAHPNSDYKTFNFLLPDGAQVFLPEILDGKRGLTKLSGLVAADLIKTVGTGPDALSDPGWIKRGTAPDANNFEDFVWQGKSLHILFPPYVVAAYAAGPQEDTVPIAKLKDVIRADWRAPAPSFDCALARATIEHAICADAGLARLDRQVAEGWRLTMANAYEPAAKQKLLQEQRDWLARRDATCRMSAPGACLKTLYAARLAVLNRANGK